MRWTKRPLMLHFPAKYFTFFCNQIQNLCESLKQKSNHLFMITEPGIKAVAAGQTLPFKLGLSREMPSIISRRDSVRFRKYARIRFGSNIYSTHCAVNGKLERKMFSVKNHQVGQWSKRNGALFCFFIRAYVNHTRKIFYTLIYFNIKVQFKDSPPRLCIWKGLR